MLGTAILKEHIFGPKPRKLKTQRLKNMGNAQIANRIDVPKKLAKTLKSTCEGVCLLKLKLYGENLWKTFEILEQLFSRNTFQMTGSDNDKTEIRKYNVVSCLNRYS